VASGVHADIFPAAFDDKIAIGPQEGNNAFFGRDVLRGLVEGIDDFVNIRQPRWRQFRSLGPALLGCAMWMDDPQLLSALETLQHVCIVVRKEKRNHTRMPLLREAAERIPGIPTSAFPGLIDLAPKIDGKPMVVGPYTEMGAVIPSIRSMGFRAPGLPPVVHAKLAILGHFWWHDEGPIGNVEDVIGFTAKRLWVSSANFTRGSRRSLDFGYWTEEPALIEGVQGFLLRLIAASEPIDAPADGLDPELASVEFDNEAMAEALAEMGDLDDQEDD